MPRPYAEIDRPRHALKTRAGATTAMEHVSLEDLPRVLGNLRRAGIPGGHLYMTVEETDDDVIGKALDRMTALRTVGHTATCRCIEGISEAKAPTAPRYFHP